MQTCLPHAQPRSRIIFRLLNSLLAVGLVFSAAFNSLGQEPIFSGPQISERLPALPVKIVVGEATGKELDVVAEANGKPQLLIFFHAVSRPAFAVTRGLAKFAASRADKGLSACVVFLGNDPTETEKWLTNIQKNLPPGVLYGISKDGIEGPGAYGLNRNAALTILVAQDGKVTYNAALVQPQLQVDGPKILQAIVDATGGGKVPTIEELEAGTPGSQRMQGTPPAAVPTDTKLADLLRQVINRQASAEAVQKAAAAVEEYVKDNAAARKELARITKTIVSSGKLENYGTPPAQKVISQWHDSFDKIAEKESSPGGEKTPQQDPVPPKPK